KDRLQTFRNSAHTVELLLSIPGDIKLERKLQSLFSESKITRELFRFDQKTSTFIDTVRRLGPNRALDWLDYITPAQRQKRETENTARIAAARQTRAGLDAHYAGLVADRKKRLGW